MDNLKIKNTLFDWGTRTYVMGVLNLTPDSFSGDGLADFDEKLAAQLTEVTWRGGGEINLKTEELQVGIRPKPRKGIPIGAGGPAGNGYISQASSSAPPTRPRNI